VQPPIPALRRRHCFAVREPMEQKMTTISSPAAQPSIPTFGGMIRWAGKGAHALASYLERRRAIKALRELDDRALRDIGIARCHIEQVVIGDLDLIRLRVGI
jgi:uncharacterized protein YjiS (DUF1127 family)